MRPLLRRIQGALDDAGGGRERKLASSFFTLSKSYNMPGWRVGFAVGNREMIAALARLKSYFDYGMFAPVQVAAIAALNGPQEMCQRDQCDVQSGGATCSLTG